MEQINSFVCRLQKEESQTIVGLGDSLTQGWMVSQGFYDRFIGMLRQRYPSTPLKSCNYGVPGSTAAEAINRVPEVLADDPDLVIVQFGLNDCAAGIPVNRYKEHLERICSPLREAGANVILVTSCPVREESLNLNVLPYYEAVTDSGSRLGLPVIELHTYWMRQADTEVESLYQPDGIHPTDAGHMLMAKGLLAAITQ